MAIYINNTPQNISNEGKFTVLTDLVEDATHVNLRIRGELYFEGEIKAVVEKPKGLSEFDFGDILKSLQYEIKLARDTGALTQTGAIGSNLITEWLASADFSTLTTSAHAISSAISSSWAFTNTNYISFEAGEIYSLWVNPYIPTLNAPMIEVCSVLNTEIKHHRYVFLLPNKTTLIMPTESFTGWLRLGTYVGAQNFSGTFFLHKVTTDKSLVGGGTVPYSVVFTEYYEVAGVTTVGLDTNSKVYRYVQAKGDNISFMNYILNQPTSLMANKTLSSAVRFYTFEPKEYFVSFFTEHANIIFNYRKDGGSTVTSNIICAEGWGLVLVNIGELMASVVTSLQFWFSVTDYDISAIFTVTPSTLQISERVVLEFDGLVGGKEYLAFEGMKDKSYVTIRNYYTGEKKNRKPIQLNGFHRQMVATRFSDAVNSIHLEALLESENVKKLELNYATPTDVTIITEVVKTESSELFTNPLELEFE